MNIVVYSKSNCPNCTSAKRLLDDKGIGYMEYSVDDPTVMAAFIATHQGIRQMPQCFISGQRVGGLVGLQQALKELGLL